METGKYTLSNSDYHKQESLGSSNLKDLLRSPAHYLASLQNPIEPTPQMVLGSVVHCLLLETHLFESLYAVGEHKQRRGKEYEKCVSENVGKTIITKEQFAEATRLVEEVKNQVERNEVLKSLLEGIKETSFFWEDPSTGILCKARPDIITPSGIIVDIKTSSDGSFDAFQKQMVDLKYFLSMAWYMRGYKETCSKTGMMVDVNKFMIPVPTRAVFVVIETKDPYAIATYELDESAIRVGHEMCDKALEIYAEAVSTETWESYPKKLVTMGLPNWAFFKFNKPEGDK